MWGVWKFSAGSQDSTSHHRLYRENSFKCGKAFTKKSSELLSHRVQNGENHSLTQKNVTNVEKFSTRNQDL